MEKDAVSAGVSQVGGLFSTAEIKMLVCYIYATINEPVPGRRLADLLHMEGIANCFEVNDAIDSLCQSGQLKLFNESDDTYVITESGKSISETLKTSLPYAVKDRAYAAALKMLSRFKNTRDTNVDVVHEDGRTYLQCSLIDRDINFLTVKLLVSDNDQAFAIREKFLDNPAKVYTAVIEALTGDL